VGRYRTQLTLLLAVVRRPLAFIPSRAKVRQPTATVATRW